MPSHINPDGQFQSDLHPELPPGKFILSFKDPKAWPVLLHYADLTTERALARDIETGVVNAVRAYKPPNAQATEGVR